MQRDHPALPNLGFTMLELHAAARCGSLPDGYLAAFLERQRLAHRLAGIDIANQLSEMNSPVRNQLGISSADNAAKN